MKRVRFKNERKRKKIKTCQRKMWKENKLRKVKM